MPDSTKPDATPFAELWTTNELWFLAGTAGSDLSPVCFSCSPATEPRRRRLLHARRIFLRRRGIELSPERTYRLWRKAGLQLPKKRRRKRVARSRPRPTPPATRNDVWAYDFVFDACADGKHIKRLTVVDEWTRVPGD